MTINGLPLHPLVVHAAVVFTPLAALAAILFTVPKWRWLLRWPTLVLAIGSALFIQVAYLSGEDLQKQFPTPQVEVHEEWAEKLRIAVFVLALLAIVAFWAFGHVTRLQGGADREAKAAALEKPLIVLLPVAAVAVLVLVFLTGDAGAKAVWG